jgi:hypothetical protein
VDGVRGLMLKKEYQEYKFTTIQSLKDQFLEYELKYKRMKKKRAEISDKEKKDYLLISLSKSFIHTLTMIFIYNPNTKLDDMTYENIKSMMIGNYGIEQTLRLSDEKRKKKKKRKRKKKREMWY